MKRGGRRWRWRWWGATDTGTDAWTTDGTGDVRPRLPTGSDRAETYGSFHVCSKMLHTVFNSLLMQRAIFFAACRGQQPQS